MITLSFLAAVVLYTLAAFGVVAIGAVLVRWEGRFYQPDRQSYADRHLEFRPADALHNALGVSAERLADWDRQIRLLEATRLEPPADQQEGQQEDS